MNFTVLTCLWKRPELASLMLRHTLRVLEEAGVVGRVVAVRSPGDEQETIDGVDYAEASNSPLSNKWQAGLDEAAPESDAVMLLGSDDFVTAGIIRAAAAAMERGVDVWGLSDFRFLAAGPRACYWPGYTPESGRVGEPMGACRTFRRGTLAILGDTLWPDGLERGLDGACWQRILAAQQFLDIHVETVPTMSTGGMAVDVKRATDTHLSTFESYIATGSEDVSWRDVVNHFPPELVEAWDLDPMPAFTERNAMWLAGVTEKEQLTSLVMIAKDAEATIERAIRCAMPFVGEIVLVVDDRTTDRTAEIAKELGARVYSRGWTGFADQRNHAHGLADGAWHLVLDADETLEPDDLAECIALAEKEQAAAVMVTTIGFSKRGQDVPSRQARVLRQDKALWRYRRQNTNALPLESVVDSGAVVRNSYIDRLTGLANAAIPELLEMYMNPSDPNAMKQEERAHAALYISRSYMALSQWDQALVWARLVHDELPDDHLNSIQAAACEAWATLLTLGPDAAYDFASDWAKRAPGVAELEYICGSIRLMRCYRGAMCPGRFGVMPQSCLAFMPGFPKAFMLLGFPFEITIVDPPAAEDAAPAPTGDAPVFGVAESVEGA
jgi:hypothetical protein